MSRARRRRPATRPEVRTGTPTRPAGVLPVPELTEPAPPVRPTAIPDAVVRSLGPPALAGHEAAATHTFAAVYERAVGLATALASAAGLLSELPDDEGEPEPVVPEDGTGDDADVGEQSGDPQVVDEASGEPGSDPAADSV